jgi:hypothetical protein
MSTVKERIDDILRKPMTRQQFLKHVGLLLLAVVGITNIINTFEGKSTPKTASGGSDGSTYGVSAYAGGKKPV